MTNETAIAVQVPFETVDGLDQALEFIEERLIGRIPPAIDSLLATVATADTRPMLLVDNNGLPFASRVHADSEDGEPEPYELTADEEASVAQHELLMASPEWQAELEAAERYHEWKQTQRARMEIEYRSWLDEQAEEFARARLAWWRTKNAALRAEFDAAT